MLCIQIFTTFLCPIFPDMGCCSPEEKATVNIGNAQVIGQTVTFDNVEVHEFLGLPFAHPPVGDLRFKPSLPFPSYEGTILANKKSPACPQYTKNPYPWYDSGTEKSEDCLYLNIWAQAKASPSNTKAVFFWLLPGGFRYGSSRLDVYDGKVLSALGDIVVVTGNYRMGTFGFFYSGTQDAPGNAGLWDIALGLQWVNQYIGAFGGDTSRITVGGESAGAVATGLLNIMPTTKNLFQRMIMESGSPLVDITDGGVNMDYGDQLALKVSCGNDTYKIQDHPTEITECLKGIGWEELSIADSTINPHFSANFFPIFGDTLLPEDPRLAVAKKDFYCGELLTGLTANEGSNFISTSNPDVFGFFGEKDTKINRSQAESYISGVYKTHYPSMADAAVEHYLPDDTPDDGYLYRNRSCDAMGDYNFVCTVEEFARQCARSNKVYFYEFLHRSSSSPFAEWEGATHYGEVEFVFGRPIEYPEMYMLEDIELSQKMVRIWSDFIKLGSPGEDWPLYSADNEVVLNLAAVNSPREGVAPHLEDCKFVSKALGFVPAEN